MKPPHGKMKSEQKPESPKDEWHWISFYTLAIDAMQDRLMCAIIQTQFLRVVKNAQIESRIARKKKK
jgi:hypothetical protein